MMQQEFEERIGKQVTSSDYTKIEYVYNFYPTLDNVKGKDQIATLYKIGGMRLICDMEATAQKAEALEVEIRKARKLVEELNEKYQALKEK